MNTIVLKGENYSLGNKRDLRKTEIKDIKVVMIYPSGETLTFETSKVVLNEVTENANDTIIYGHIFTKED